MTDITIKFDRPQGEARLSWVSQVGHSQGGFVAIAIHGVDVWPYSQGEAPWAKYIPDPAKRAEILKEAERLRNEKRRLAEDEWRSEQEPGAGWCWFSEPTLGGFTVTWSTWEDGQGIRRLLTDESDYSDKVLKWHRAAYFPLLSPDECYPPGELPRKMVEDEVRDGTGAAHQIHLERRYDGSPYRLVFGSWSWQPGDRHASRENNPENVPGQLARLQAFWERSQSKEAFFAASPPVELAEEAKPKCVKCNGTGRSCGDRHCPYQWCTPCVDCGPLAKPEPARVTDVRFGPDRDVDFIFNDSAYFYRGVWANKELHAALHPLDIALIERCWEEGRLGEREVLTDQGIVGVVSDRRIDLKNGPIPWLCGPVMTDDDDEAWDWGADDDSYRITIHDPTQRARVRAIVAALKEPDVTAPGAIPTSSSQAKQSDACGSSSENSSNAGAVLTEAHSVSPSGEVKAPTRDELRAEIAQRAKELEAATRRAGESGASSICVSWPGETVVDLTELREAWGMRGALGDVEHIMAAVEMLVGK